MWCQGLLQSPPPLHPSLSSSAAWEIFLTFLYLWTFKKDTSQNELLYFSKPAQDHPASNQPGQTITNEADFVFQFPFLERLHHDLGRISGSFVLLSSQRLVWKPPCNTVNKLQGHYYIMKIEQEAKAILEGCSQPCKAFSSLHLVILNLFFLPHEQSWRLPRDSFFHFVWSREGYSHAR